MSGRSLAAVAVALLALGSAATLPRAAAAIARPQALLKAVYRGLSAPVLLTHAGDGSGRAFIVEQAGRIRIAKGGQLLPRPFLDISSLVLSGGERGLLGLAFPPGYAASGRFYVYYTALSGANVIARFRVSSDPDRALRGSREEILRMPHPNHPNHNGGMIAFGPDGHLYAGTGDGGGAGDPDANAQDLGSLLGKMLRIDVEGPSAGYRSPPDNPFAGATPGRDEIWAYGLRNPWRWSFDRATGDLYVGDVGQNAVEEIDHLPADDAAGANLGWDVREGNRCYPPGTACTSPPAYVPPAVTYTHTEGCSVTGGYVSRLAAYPQLAGMYLYADYCGGWIRGARRVGGVWETVPVVPGDGARRIASFGEDERGAVHVVDLAAGTVSRLASPLFADRFGVPGPDADWQAVTGAWTANVAGAFAPDPGRANLAFVASGILPAINAGRIDVTVTLPADGANASLVFAGLDRSRYRYVRLEPGRVRIGQVGDFGGAAGGVKVTVAAPVPAGGPVQVRCAVHASGLVRVHLGGAAAPVAEYRFPQGAPGRVGLAARFSTATFDLFTAWDRFALP